MLTIKINNQLADINRDMKIPMKFENPLFSDNFMNEGYSYSWELPNTPKNKNLLKKKDLSIKVFFKGVLFINGVIDSYNRNGDSIGVHVVTDAKDLRKTLETTKLNELDFEDVTICEQSDIPIIKINKWEAYINDNLSQDVRDVSHTFPNIKTWGYNNRDTDDSEVANFMFEYGQNMINRHGMGSSLLNFQVPISYDGGKNNWITTVAPCPMIKYLFESICKKHNLKIRTNQLDSIDEYVQMWAFNNYVLDKREGELSSFSTYNVHGLGFNLRNHVTDCDMFNVLTLLNEVFDAFFIIDGYFIDIFLAKNSINVPAKNVSKYASENFINDPGNSTGFIVSYQDDDIEKYKVGDTTVEEEGITVSQYIYTHKTIQFPNNKTNNEPKTLKNVPLLTENFGKEPGYLTSFGRYQEYLDDTLTVYNTYGYGQLEYNAISKAYIKSDYYDNNAEIFTKIFFGLYRGIHPGYKPGYNPDDSYNASLDTYPNTLVTCNFKNPIFINEDNGVFIYPYDTDPIFGTSSIFINGPDNSFDLYKKDKLRLLFQSTIKTKLLYLPVYELLQLLKWKNIKHVIQQKKESFTGYVKTVSFTLSNLGLSPTEVEYVVANTDLGGSFSEDFSEDYEIE